MLDQNSRREFLQRASAGAVALSSLAATAAQAAKGPSDKIVVGLIGCGGRGTHDAGLFQKTPNVELAYVCDVDENRRGSVAKSLGVATKGIVSDLRRILDDK